MNYKADSDRHTGVISASAQQIWSAGLGALALAEKEGSRFFDTLTKLGESIHSRTLKTASFAKQTVSGGRHTATEGWDKLEEMFELRVGRALNALQIPTARDIKELTTRVDDLARSVEELGATKTTTRKTRTRTASVAKKKTTGKKKKANATRTKTTKTKASKTRATRTTKSPAARKKKKKAVAKSQRKRARA